MKHKKMRYPVIIILGMLLLCNICTYAADMSGFPYQNPNHFSASYTRGLQAMLNDHSASHSSIGGTSGIDGDYGNRTAMAVAKFQGFKNITVDGSCGPMTWATLRNSLNLYMIDASHYYYYYMTNTSGLAKNRIVYQKSSNSDWYCYTGVRWKYVG